MIFSNWPDDPAGKGGHHFPVRKNGRSPELQCHAHHIIAVAAKVNVLARKRKPSAQLWFLLEISGSPVIYLLTADDHIRFARRIPRLQNFAKLFKGERHGRAGHLLRVFGHGLEHLAKVRDAANRTVQKPRGILLHARGVPASAGPPQRGHALPRLGPLDRGK
ncbi:MAG: hypothetical protein ABSE16_10545 [Verrucomicrobiota bacterium]